MTQHFDERETRDPRQREIDQIGRLSGLVATALKMPGWRRHLGELDPAALNTRAAFASLPVLRKSQLPELQKGEPPFGGLVDANLASFGRLFASPGPIFEAETRNEDAWRVGRGVFAAGFRAGDLVLNTFSYHLTPGGFILDSGMRAVGCCVIPAGPGNTEQQLELIAQYRPVGYCGTPDFLKILLDAGDAAAKDLSSIRKAVLSGAAFTASLRAEFKARGIDAYQLYATADIGLIAYETSAREGMVVNEDVLLEIVKPGTSEPAAEGDVGEVVVTSFDAQRPWIRLALGDLSAIISGASPCGRTNTRIKGWLGRADQSAKIKGMFLRPEQLHAVARKHPELGRLRLVVTRAGEADAMTLFAESRSEAPALGVAVADSLRAITQLGGKVELVASGSLPNDGKLIDDRRGVD